MTTVFALSPAVLLHPCSPHQAEATAPASMYQVSGPLFDVQAEFDTDLQESRLKAQDALREDEGKWVEQERKLMERRVKHQVQVMPE